MEETIAKKTHSLSILMLRPGLSSPADALKRPSDLESENIAIPGVIGSTLFYHQMVPHRPRWVELFGNQVNVQRLANSGTAAVLFVELPGRSFAFTFGYGRSLLRPYAFESNFGLRVVLNAVDPEKLRSVDVQSVEGVPVQQRTQTSKASSSAYFGLDIEKDILRAATGQPLDNSLGTTVSGKDSLKLSIPVELADLPSVLAKVEQIHASTAYKANFGWIDHLTEVRDPATTSDLDAKFVAKIAANDFSKTWLAIPEPIDWHDLECFRYAKPKKGTAVSDIDWASYLSTVDNPAALTPQVLKNQHVYAISESASVSRYDWPVYDCAYCEITSSGNTFCLINGKWYQIDGNFLNTVESFVRNIAPASIKLPGCTFNNEDEYNKAVRASNPAFYALMDKVSISYGGGHSKIEFCDLFTTGKHLIHVKRYGQSSVLSHLFSQGVVSARLFVSDPDFRAKLNQALPASHMLPDTAQRPTATEYELIYAIISNSANRQVELPLFSKINVRNAVQMLRAFGMKVSLAVVPISTAPSVAAS